MIDNTTRPPKASDTSNPVVVGIPAYNEENTIGDIVEKARAYVDYVIVVDDGSSDRTAERAADAGAVVVEHERNRGYGSALGTIFTEADRRGVTHLAILDADGQHDPSDVGKLVESQRSTDAEIVIGSRFTGGTSTNAPLYRRIGLTIINTLTNFGLRLAYQTPRLTDTQSGFRVYDAEAIETMSNQAVLGEGMEVSIDILFEAARAGHEIVETPIEISYDVEDANTHHPIVQGFVLLASILARLYDERPSRLLNIPAFVCVVVGGGLAMAMVSDAAVSQAVPLLLVAALFSAGLMLSGAAFVLDRIRH